MLNFFSKASKHNSGAGIDVSDSATAEIRGGVIRGNVGGLWLWQSGRATCTDAHLEGGSAHVILADQDGLPSLEVHIRKELGYCGLDL